MKSYRSSLSRLLVICGACGVMLGATSIASSADRIDDLRKAVRHDQDVIRQDEHRIRDMQNKRALQMRHHDYDLARRTQADIDRARLDLKRDQAKLRVDQRELRHDRPYYRGHRR
jgi:hypothetical protein